VYRLAALMSGEALIAKVNTEQLPEIASQHQVQSIPTFVLFARGRESARTSGAMSAARLREFIQHNGR
jgi:thioredoxin 2